MICSEFIYIISLAFSIFFLSCQWGHDFRPDYTQLGILKMHFPHIPLIAVTATASQRVREDTARILRIGTNYQLFRSTANRNNLNYSIRPKPDGAQKVIDDMIDFIKTNHPTGGGIIYCFSRKEAEDVANRLCAGGIVARPYHAEISQEQKDLTQRSWQRNQTQVVVGECRTVIAFIPSLTSFRPVYSTIVSFCAVLITDRFSMPFISLCDA